MDDATNPHSAPRTGRRSELHGLRELATQLYALLSSGQHGLAYAVGRGGPALILREADDGGREGGASPESGGSIGGESPGPDKVGGGSIRVLRFVGDVPQWERAKELIGGVERDRTFTPWTLLKHLIGDYAVAPMAGGWVQWVALDIDAHPRNGEGELDARRRAKRVLGAVWRALNCSATRHPLVLRSPGGGYHVWLPLTRGPASANAEHTWPAQMVQRCVAWHLAQAGLELGPGNLEVFPSGVGLRAPCGRGMVLLQATQPDDPDALGLVPWPGTATGQVDWGDGELAPKSRRLVPMVRTFIEQWEVQRRTLADWLSRPEFEWESQWGPLGWREGHNDIPRWREIFCGEKNSAQNPQGKSRSQQSDDGIHRARGGLPLGGEGEGEAGTAHKGRSGSSSQRVSSSPSAPDVNLSPDSAGGKLVRGREFREKYTTLLLEGVTQPSTRFDAVHTLVFYWGATCGRPEDEVLERLEDWCHEHPHQGARNHNRPRVFVRECLREARSYLKRKAPGWRFRGGGHAGGLVSLSPADRVVTAAVDPRVAFEVGALLAWLKGHADTDGRVLDPVQISHGLLRRLCGDRRVDIDGDGRRHRVATLVLTELERLGVLTLASNYRVGQRGRVWCCWYRFGSGELPRAVALPAAKWDQIQPFSTEPLVPAPALLQVAPSEPQEATSAPLVEVRVLAERVVPEGLLSALSACARGLPRALLTRAPGVDRPTAAPAPRPPWFERGYRCLQLTPRRLWRADAATVGPDASELRGLPRSLRLDLGGGGRDARRVPSSDVTGIAPIAEVSTPSSAIAPAAVAVPDPASGSVEPSAGGTLLQLVIPQPARSGAAAIVAISSSATSAATAGPDTAPSEAPEPDAPAHAPASLRPLVDADTGAASGVASAARAGPGDVAAAGERSESALRAELADNTGGAGFTAACDPDVLETLCQAWNAFLERGRGS